MDLISNFRSETTRNQTCKVCHRDLPLSEFEHQKNRPNPRRICKACRYDRRDRTREAPRHREYMRQRRHNDPGGVRRNWERSVYGTCKEDIGATSCMVCGSDDRLCIDHDHATGEVRGILCTKCNFAIGLFADDVTRLRSAIAYLEPRLNRAPAPDGNPEKRRRSRRKKQMLTVLIREWSGHERILQAVEVTSEPPPNLELNFGVPGKGDRVYFIHRDRDMPAERVDSQSAMTIYVMNDHGRTVANYHFSREPVVPVRTHCELGHEFTKENTIFRGGDPICRQCENAGAVRAA